jgi:hypothetical protein
MLLKENISTVTHGSEEWKQLRIAKMTASKAYNLTKPKGLTISYIRAKVGESITRVPSEKEIDNDGTRHGILYEAEGIREFAARMGIKLLVTQRAIMAHGSMFSATPDAIWVKSESADGLSYEVSCAEIKCFPTFEHHVEMLECFTPQDVKAADPDVYWQVLFQMVECDCLVGYAVFFHPDFPPDEGRLRIIEFRKMQKDEVNNSYPIVEDLKFLKQRKEMAVAEFNRIKTRIVNPSATAIH